jgi:hypothetical protein
MLVRFYYRYDSDFKRSLLIKLGKDTEGLSAIIGSLVALAGVFVYGRKRESKELKEKSQALSQRMNPPPAA